MSNSGFSHVVVYDVRERVDLDHSLIISNLIICPFGLYKT